MTDTEKRRMETTHNNLDNEPFSLLLLDQLFWKLCYGASGCSFKPTIFNKTISLHEAQKLLPGATRPVSWGYDEESLGGSSWASCSSCPSCLPVASAQSLTCSCSLEVVSAQFVLPSHFVWLPQEPDLPSAGGFKCCDNGSQEIKLTFPNQRF